jgi:hypothetical protein
MPKKVEPTPPSEEIAIPFEVFETFFQKEEKKKIRQCWGLAISLLFALAVLATLIALPFLVPTLIVLPLTSSSLFLPYILFIAPISLYLAFIAPVIFGHTLFKTPRFNLTENNIKIHSGTYHFLKELPENRLGRIPHNQIKLNISAPGITLSKIKKNNTEYTLVSPNKADSISGNILSSSSLEAKTYTMISIIIADLDQNNDQLKNKKSNLSKQMDNPKNSPKKTSMLSSKLAVIEQQIAQNDQTLNILQPVRESLTFKTSTEYNYRFPIQRLIDFLKDYKKHLSHVYRDNMKINQNIEQLKKEKKKYPTLETLSDKIQALEALKRKNLKLDKLRSILDSIDTATTELQNMKQGRPQSEIDYINYAINKISSDKHTLSTSISEIDPVLYIEYFNEEATQHYSRLLHDKASSQETIKLLDKILIEYPNSDHPVNQTVNYILANHFYRKFKKNRTDAIIERACQAALKLDSSDHFNKELKEMIILHAFYKDPLNSDLPAGITDLLRTSHHDPDSYHKIKNLIEPSVPYLKSPVQFSSPEQNASLPSSSQTTKTTLKP